MACGVSRRRRALRPRRGLAPRRCDGGGGGAQVGQCVDVRGPRGDIVYRGRGRFRVGGQLLVAPHLALVAGGTGITPIFQARTSRRSAAQHAPAIHPRLRSAPRPPPQVVCKILASARDGTRMSLVYCNTSEGDILLRNELDGLAASRPNFTVWYMLGSPPQGWPFGAGRIDAATVADRLPPPGGGGGDERSLALLCGPPGLQDSARALLTAAGYEDGRILAF